MGLKQLRSFSGKKMKILRNLTKKIMGNFDCFGDSYGVSLFHSRHPDTRALLLLEVSLLGDACFSDRRTCRTRSGTDIIFLNSGLPK